MDNCKLEYFWLSIIVFLYQSFFLLWYNAEQLQKMTVVKHENINSNYFALMVNYVIRIHVASLILDLNRLFWKPIKGVAASEVPEVSLLYACIDLNSHSKQVLLIAIYLQDLH